MGDKSSNERIELALCAAAPFGSLWSLAKTFKAEGMTQNTMYQLFDQYRAKHEKDADEMKYNALLDTMDLIVDWCKKGEGLLDE